MDGVKWEEDRYHALVNLIDQGFFIIDVIFDADNKPIDMYYAEANKAATQMLGMDFTGRRLRDIDPNYEEYWFEAFGNVALTGQSARLELYADPDKRWYSFYIFKIGDEKSRRIGNIFLDITERKKTEEALKESEQLFRTLFENTEDGFVLVQPIFDETGYSDNYLMVDVNRAWEKQTGLKAAELIGKTIRECFPEVEPVWPSTFAGVLKSGKSARFESFKRDSGRWYDLYAFIYKKDQVGVLFRDITERKTAEEAQRQSEERLRMAINASRIVIWDADLLTWKSSGFEDMGEIFGVLPANDMTEGLNIYHPDDRARVLEEFNRAVEKGGDYQTEWRMPTKDGEFRMLTIGKVVKDSSGRAVRAFGVIQDITARKQAEEALKKSEERFRIAQEISPDGFTILHPVRDEKGTVVDFTWVYENDTIAQINGTAPQKVIGKRLLELFPGHLGTPIFDAYCHVAATGENVVLDEASYMGETISNLTWFRLIVEPMGEDIVLMAQDITERKLMEDMLRESEKLAVSRARELEEAVRQKEDVLESITDCFYCLDKELRFIYINKAAEEIWGMSRAELLGRRIEDVFNDLIDISMSKFHQALSEQIPQRYEIFSKVAQKWGDMSVCPTRDGISVYFRDITERKLMEEALRESEERFRTLFENAEYGFVLIKPLFDNNGQVNDLYYLQINPAFERVTGFKAEDFLGKRLSEALPGVEPRWLYSFDEAFRSGKPARDEGYNQNTDRWYEQIVFPYPGRLLGEQFLDITERKRLNLQQELLLEISRELVGLTSIPETIDRLGEKIGRYFGVDWAMFAELVEGNEYSIASLGWNADDAISLKGTYRMRDFLSDEQLATNNAGVPTIVNDTQTDARVSAESYGALGIRSFIIVPISRNDLWRFQISIIDKKPRTWRDDEIVLLQEITGRIWARLERARAEEALKESEHKAQELVAELEKADKNKNQFISVLSHELRNPLAVIVAGLSLLEVCENQEQISKSKGIIKRQANQLCKLVDDLLDLTRMSQNKITLKIENVNLHDILKNVELDFQPDYDVRNIRLHAELPQEPVLLRADPVRLSQCVGNLLQNALKYTQASGYVTLSLAVENGEAVIRVKDNGIGMDSDFLEHIFTPFAQADTSLDRPNGGGLGLGLSIVDGIARLHGGSVTANSAGIGKGSLFTVRLPISVKSEDTQSATAIKETCRTYRILLIEDNKNLTDVLLPIFSLMGHEAYAAHNGVEGIAEAKIIRPDVIFCDIGLPGLSGYEVAKVLKADDDLKNVFLIALTGYAGEYDVDRARTSGFDRHLSKPVDRTTLNKILAEI